MSGIMNMLVAAKTTIAEATDAFFNRVTLLLNTGSTNGAQNNTFLDSSSNGYSITRSPSTGPNAPTQGTFTPFSQTGWSNYFPTNAATSQTTLTASVTAFGTGNFTIEFNYYFIAHGSGTVGQLYESGTNGIGILIENTNQLRVFQRDGAGTSTTLIASGAGTAITVNAWSHIALVRTGTGTNQLTLYVDGASVGTGTSSANYTSTTGYINGRYTGANYFPVICYISNLRVSTTNRTITVPTAFYTSDASTTLLTCISNRFVNVVNGNSLTVLPTATVEPTVQAFSPFNPTAAYDTAVVGGSAYLDGTGDYLTVANATPLQFDAGAFTIQCWIYRNASGVAHTIAAKGSSTTGWVFSVNASNQLNWTDTSTSSTTTDTIPVGAWTHVAAVRTSTATNGMQLYINGVSKLTFTVSTTYSQTSALTVFAGRTQANSFNGYVAGLEYVKGTALTISVPTAPPTTANSPSLLLNFTNAGIYDAAAKNDLETVGSTQVSTTQTKFGTTSILFNGTTDYLLAVDRPNLQLGTGDFTIEGWVYLTAANVAYGIISKGTGSTGWSVNITSGNKLQFSYTATALTGATSLSSGTWYYFAVVRSGTATGNLKVYLDGSVDATSGGAVTTDFNQTNSMYVGASRTGTTLLSGYLDDIRITKYARSISTPTSAFQIQ
jgi:hypothetical protein